MSSCEIHKDKMEVFVVLQTLLKIAIGVVHDEGGAPFVGDGGGL